MSVRITAREKNQFDMLALAHNTSTSNWAYHILSKHKDSYGKIENKNMLLEGIELTIEGLRFAHDELSKLQIDDSSFSEKTANYELLKTKLYFKVEEFKKLKEEIMELM